MTDISAEALKFLLASSIAIGLWVCLSLAFFKTGKRAANLLLMSFVACQLLPPINVYAQMAFGTIDWCWILTTNLTWLYGPFLLAFIQLIRGVSPSPTQIATHSTPFMIALALRLSPWSPAIIYFVIPLFIHIFAYLAFCLYLLFRHKAEISNAGKPHKRAQFYWLLYLIAGLASLMLIDVYLISLFNWADPLPLKQWQYLVALTSLYLQGIALFSIYRPQVFFNSIRHIREQSSSTPRLEAAANTNPEKQYRSIDADIAQQLEPQLNSLMETEKPWLDNDLSLSALAKQLGITSHQLSELLNVHFKKSFYEHINQYRMNYALELIKKETGKAILDIAYDAGFNNKNSFYRLFKERTGMTPSNYRKAQSVAKSA